MADLRKDAIEQLRIKAEAAQAAAMADPLWSMEISDLAGLVQEHPLGRNHSGWSNPYAKDDPRSLLLEYQFRYFHDSSRFKVALQSRQTGKDFTNEGEAVTDCLARDGTDWLVGAPSERQSLDSLDQAKLWADAYGLYIDDYKVEREGDSNTLLKSAEIIFSNKSRIRAVPGRPDTVRGRSANVLLTEFDFFENAAATWRAILPSITNPLRGGEKKVRLASTPNGKGGAMYRIWTKPDTPKMRWSRHLVTIYHAVLMGLPVDVAQVREALDDEEGFQQEYLCAFLDTSSVLLPYEIIALAESGDATEVIDSEFWSARDGGPIVCGIDFGRTNDPTICWTLQRVGDVWHTREVLALRGMSTPEQQEKLRVRIARASRCCYDYTGPGIGLGDYLVKEPGLGRWDPAAHEFGKIELCTFSAGFKREIFPKLRRAFELPTKLRIPISVEIREDLHAMQQLIRNGEYSYAAPRTAEGHSDRCTALALALRATGISGGPFAFTPIERDRSSLLHRRRSSIL